MNIIALDFETSGCYPGCACAIGMARIENLAITDTYYSLVRPPSRRIFFTHVHGLRWQDLKDAEPFAAIWPTIQAFIEGADYLLAHNAIFDRGVLAGCCNAFNTTMPKQPFLCTLKGSRKALQLPSRSLGYLCQYFGITLNHHHAGSDAQGCAQIYINLIKMGLPLEEMVLAPARKKRATPN